MPEIFAEVECTTAAEFLDRLLHHRDPPRLGAAGAGISSLWNRPEPVYVSWLFRGHAEARWNLTPSAHRGRNSFQPFTPPRIQMPDPTPMQCLAFEANVVSKFATQASVRGVEIPWDSWELRDPTAFQLQGADGYDFPPPRFRGMYALAQHYGVPTRLLDWSRSPLVAAYFALVGGAARYLHTGHPEQGERLFPGQKPDADSDGKCALWAVSGSFVRDICGEMKGTRAAVVTVPASNNPNLLAQQGLFTLVFFDRNHEAPLASLPPPLDKWMREEENELTQRAADANHVTRGASLIKITLPHTEAASALYSLHLLGVDASTIFDGRDAVTRSLKESWLRRFWTPPISRPMSLDAPAPKTRAKKRRLKKPE